jgi:leucine dehydrogenase
LARFLYEEGTNLVICDNDENKIRRFFGWAAIVDPDEVCKVECDILAPCITLGGILNEEIIAKLNCAIIIGSTNNMLASPNCATLLRKRGILYGPDFVVNAGGLMNVYEELQPGGYNEANVLKRIAETIPLNLFKIFRRSEKLNLSTHEVAKIMAQERIKLKKDKISILADLFRTTNKEIKDMLEGEESVCFFSQITTSSISKTPGRRTSGLFYLS